MISTRGKPMKTSNLARLAAIFMLSTMFVSSSCFAFKIGNLLGDESGSEGAKIDFGAAESDVVALMNSSFSNVFKAQEIISQALGLREVADAAGAEAKRFEEGSATGKDEMADAIKNSDRYNDRIVEKMSEKQDMDDEAKLKFGTALPFYAKGAISGIQGGNKAVATAKSIKKNPLKIMKFKTVMYVAKKAPKLIKNFTTITKAMKEFATYQGIPTDSLDQVGRAEESGL
jgi:hypothetical protein